MLDFRKIRFDLTILTEFTRKKILALHNDLIYKIYHKDNIRKLIMLLKAIAKRKGKLIAIVERVMTREREIRKKQQRSTEQMP